MKYTKFRAYCNCKADTWMLLIFGHFGTKGTKNKLIVFLVFVFFPEPVTGKLFCERKEGFPVRCSFHPPTSGSLWESEGRRLNRRFSGRSI